MTRRKAVNKRLKTASHMPSKLSSRIKADDVLVVTPTEIVRVEYVEPEISKELMDKKPTTIDEDDSLYSSDSDYFSDFKG